MSDPAQWLGVIRQAYSRQGYHDMTPEYMLEPKVSLGEKMKSLNSIQKDMEEYGDEYGMEAVEQLQQLWGLGGAPQMRFIPDTRR